MHKKKRHPNNNRVPLSSFTNGSNGVPLLPSRLCFPLYFFTFIR